MVDHISNPAIGVARQVTGCTDEPGSTVRAGHGCWAQDLTPQLKDEPELFAAHAGMKFNAFKKSKRPPAT